MARWHNYIAADLIHHNTVAAAFEITCHLTGDYPPWWDGFRFDRPTRWWAAGESMQLTRDIPQVELLGEIDGLDTLNFNGMIPKHRVVSVTRKSGGVAKCADQVTIKHRSGGKSVLGFRSYDQGIEGFQGTEQEGVWLDEEPPADIYSECLTRTATTNGLILCTFTPLQGMTPFIAHFLKTSIMLNDDNAPLLDLTTKRPQPAYERFFPEQS